MRNTFQALPPDVLVILIDGFDTRILQRPEVAEERYLAKYPHRPVLFSKDCCIGLPLIAKYVQRRIFGDYDVIANAGMYMGPAGKVAALMDLAMAFEASCKGDDQCAFNKLRAHIEVDESCYIFRNLLYSEREHADDIDTVFLGYPMQPTVGRATRAVIEYTPFLWQEIICVVVVVLVMIRLCRRI
jgi:hypothetical protein